MSFSEAYHNKIILLSYFWDKTLDSGDLEITPGGETRNQVMNRAMSKLMEITRQYPEGNILIVSHGHTIKVMICALLGLDFSNIWKINMPDCALNIFEYDGREVLFHSIGDTAHLCNKMPKKSIQKNKAGLDIFREKYKGGAGS